MLFLKLIAYSSFLNISFSIFIFVTQWSFWIQKLIKRKEREHRRISFNIKWFITRKRDREFPEKVNSTISSDLTPKTIRLNSFCNVIHAGNSLDLRHNLRRLCEIFDRTLWSTTTRESQWSIRGRLCHTVLWNSNRIQPHGESQRLL